MAETELKEISRSLMPLSLKILKQLYRDDLIIIILEREIAFNNLREEYLKILKKDFKDSFEIARINLSLTYTQEQLITKFLVLVKELAKLKDTVTRLHIKLRRYEL